MFRGIIRLHLSESELISFRNYEKLNLSWSKHANILLGMNAQGKTNLLESIYFLTLAKSHRTSSDKEMIRFGDSFAIVRGKSVTRLGNTLLEMILYEKGKKGKINGIEQSRLSDYIGTINVVMFSPDDLELIKGGPQVRRKFLDMEIGQVSPAYLYYLNRYNKILMQRNQGLKEIAAKRFDPSLLAALNEQLARYAPKVWHKRLIFLQKLSEWAREIHLRITGGKEILSLEYQGSIPVYPEMDEERLAVDFLSLLEKKADKDLERGYTIYGPHRDDLLILIDGKEVQKFGSQGQQRTAALSLKLAEIELIHEEIGDYPILLLDDVFSELDSDRQTHLLSGFWDQCQTFITTTSVELIPESLLNKASLYQIQAGTVTVR